MDYVMGDGAGNVFVFSGSLVAASVAAPVVNFDGSMLSIVGEEENYTGDTTTDSWVNTTPAGTPTGVYCDESAYLGNDVIITGFRTAANNGTLLTPYITRNGGTTWETLPAGQGYTGSYTIAIGPGKAISTNPDSGQIGYTEDYGETWVTKCANKPGGQSALYIGYAGQNELGQDVIVAGSYPNGQMWYSVDNAETWTQSSYVSGVTQIFGPIGLGDGVVCAKKNNGEIIRSTDYGVTWNSVHTCPGTHQGFITMGNNGRVFTCSWVWDYPMAGNRYYSDDKGLTWTAIADSNNSIFVALGDNKILVLKNLYENMTNNNPTFAYAYSSDNGITVSAPVSFGRRGSGKVVAGHYLGNGRTTVATSMSTAVSYGWNQEYFNAFTLGTI